MLDAAPATTMFAHLAAVLDDDWHRQARPEQLAPPGEWSIWAVLAGRGWGKTRTGAEWVRSLAEAAVTPRIALVGPTAADVRDVQVEGESGLLAISPDWFRPTYEPSKRRLTWPNGVVATCFSAEEPDRLRGPQHGAAWCDEVAAWANLDATWANLQLGLRLGTRPRVLVTTTPRPLRLIKGFLEREGRDVAVTRGRTDDNAANLAPTFLEGVRARYDGTRLGRQELDGEILTDTPGALWSLAAIDRDRVEEAPELRRVVVAIDPAVSTGENSDLTGIIVAGIDARNHAYILEDLSGKYSPSEWARKAIAAFDRHKADRIIAESNNGGQLVENTLRTVRRDVPFRAVHASRGKVTRAEPVSALYEQGRCHHVGTAMTQLEDEMTAFTSDFDRSRAGYSPDRVDALVWAVTELSIQQQSPAAVVGQFIWG